MITASSIRDDRSILVESFDDVDELQDGLVHQRWEYLLYPGHHVPAHAHLGPGVEGDGGVVGGHELGLQWNGLHAQNVERRGVRLGAKPEETEQG